MTVFSPVVLDRVLSDLVEPGLAQGGELYGVVRGARSLVLAALLHGLDRRNSRQSLLFVTTGTIEADTLAAEAGLFLNPDRIVVLPEPDGIPYEWSRHDMVLSGRRIRALDRILSGQPLLVIVPAGALIRRLPSPGLWTGAALSLRKGQAEDPAAIMLRLVESGYHRTERVEGPGEFCLKGSLLDVFPVQLDLPVRLDFFDIEIESIRPFDPETQRSMSVALESVRILPASEAILQKDQPGVFRDALKRQAGDLRLPDWAGNLMGSSGPLHSLNGRDHAGLEELLPAAFPAVSLLEVFPVPPLIAFEGDGEALARAGRVEREFDVLYEEEKKNRFCILPDQLLDRGMLPLIDTDEVDAVRGTDDRAGGIVVLHARGSDLDSGESFSTLFREPEAFSGRMSEFRKSAVEILMRGGSVVITSPYTAQIHRIAGILKSESVPHEVVDLSISWQAKEAGEPRTVGRSGKSGPSGRGGAGKASSKNAATDGGKDAGRILLLQSLRETGFDFPAAGLHVWTDSDIFGRSYKKRMRFKSKSSAPLESYLDLKEGDHVVHINHGVGRFVRLERMKAAGRERDFLVLEYAEQDRLFVPLDQISLVQKYVAPESEPVLDHLGRASFKKIREKVEKNIEQFAEELIKIYAARMKLQGYGFPPDTVWQEEFEAEFPFDETPDQLMAIQAVKEDMETARPMDRLVCGDVGYGKTEVAIRAVFKAVMGGKQAVVICPTTILALQHFKTFKERFQNFPVRIDWISRFRTPGEIRKVKEALAQGEVDVVVGTHALLAKDVRLRNLGLLVVDEEQRFGVMHKEALKRLKTQVDVLTLSATPIPRTLHMSLTGIRDLSVIQTAPRDRKPVQTLVLEDSDAALVEAVRREVERGGQVFFLHNRIQSLDAVGERLHELMPDIRYTVLHGQMHEDDIEQILLDFMERKYDLLLTTAIIENGIDMPNVNTLIVDRADQFGLSQLYQIRGRVGRSNRQAYAYFFHEGSRVLTEQAMKRLNTLLEYQELGSGFKVAMRDLEIRGAGNALGKEQSGDIIQVGYELYIKLLDNAVKRLKGEELEIEVRCTVNLGTDFYLSDDYIQDTRQRIEFYKRFEAARTEAEVENIAAEMQDRFGTPDAAASVFVRVEKIRTLGSLCGFENIYEEGGLVHLRAGEIFRVPIQHVIEIIKRGIGFFVRDGRNNVLLFEMNPARPGRGQSTVQVDPLERLLLALRELAAPVLERMEGSPSG